MSNPTKNNPPIPLATFGVPSVSKPLKRVAEKPSVPVVSGSDAGARLAERRRYAAEKVHARLRQIIGIGGGRTLSDVTKGAGVPIGVVGNFDRKRDLIPPLPVMQRLVHELFDAFILTDEWQLVTRPSSFLGYEPLDAKGNEPAPVWKPHKAINEVARRAGELLPPSSRPVLSKHEASVAFNILRVINDPVAVRAITDGLRQGIDWHGEERLARTYRSDRIREVTRFLYDRKVVKAFRDPEKTHDAGEYVTIDHDKLLWLRDQATKPY